MNPPEIDFAQAQELHHAGSAMFVDVRDSGSYQDKHIPGALHLDDSNVEQFVADTRKDAKVVVYCYHGRSSQGATAYLIEQGFTAVSSLTGGFTEWQESGGASEPDIPG